MLIDVCSHSKYYHEYLDLLIANFPLIVSKKGKELFLSKNEIWLTCRRDGLNPSLWHFVLYDDRSYGLRLFKTLAGSQEQAYLGLVDFIKSKVSGIKD